MPLWILLLTLLAGAPSVLPEQGRGLHPVPSHSATHLRIPAYHLSPTERARHQALAAWSSQMKGVRSLILRHNADFLQAQASFYNQGQWTQNRPFLLGDTERFLFFL